MPLCKKIRRKKKQLCIGDMDARVTLRNRSIQPPLFNTPDFDEAFSAPTPVWAKVDTVSGKTFFDGVNVDVKITHSIGIEFDATVTAETWVELEDGQRLDVLDIENLDERSEFMILTCTQRGASTVEAAKT